MAYYPSGYYPQYQNGAMPDMLNQYKQRASDIIWVLNENEAMAYPVAPNNTVVLWDKNNPTIYVKSANMQGVPSIRVLDFIERMEMPQKRPTTSESGAGCNYITAEQFESIKAKIERIEGTLKELEEKDDGKSAVRASKSAKSE